MSKTYTVTYEQDDKWWVAAVVEVPGCHTQGKTIEQARDRIREALAMFIGDDGLAKAKLVDDFRLSASDTEAVERFKAAEETERRVRAEVAREREEAAKALRKRFKLRDAAILLGVTFQRVAQLESAAKASKPVAKGKASVPRKRVKATSGAGR